MVVDRIASFWGIHRMLGKFRIDTWWPQNAAQEYAPDQYSSGQHPNF